MAPERLFVASADGHVGIPTPRYRDYLDPEYREPFSGFLAEHIQRWSAAEPTSVLDPAAWDWWHGKERFETGGIDSLFDPERRVKELDHDGVAVEVLFADDQNENTAPWLGGGLVQVGLQKEYSSELRMAGARAYNRWLAEFCSAAPERFIGVIAIPTLEDVDAAVAEVRRAHADGLRHSVLLPLDYEPLVHHPKNEPFWNVCSELDLTIAVHLGDGSPHWVGDDEWDFAIVIMETFFFAHRPLWCMVFGGVLERHPDLRVVFTESGADWVPGTVMQMDGIAQGRLWRSANEKPLAHLPSEQFHRQCFVANSIMQRREIDMRDAIGTDILIWGSDFGHHEGQWPMTRERMRGLFEGVPEADVRKIVGDNFVRAYTVERAAYDPLVAEIGPTAEDLGAAVDRGAEISRGRIIGDRHESDRSQCPLRQADDYASRMASWRTSTRCSCSERASRARRLAVLARSPRAHGRSIARVIELVVTDLDGSLWVREEIHPATFAAWSELEARGIPVIVATGRRLTSTRVLLARRGLAPPAIVLNGALALDLATDERFHRHHYDADVAAGVLDAFRVAGLEPCVYVEHVHIDVYVGPRPSTNPRHLASLGTRAVPADLDEIVATVPVLGFGVIGHRIEPLLHVVDAIGTRVETHLSGDSQWGGDTLTVAAPGLSKWAGVLAYCELAGLDSEQVLAIGDGPNDRELLMHAAIAVAPESAFPEAIALADHLVPPPDAGGWATVLDLV